MYVELKRSFGDITFLCMIERKCLRNCIITIKLVLKGKTYIQRSLTGYNLWGRKTETRLSNWACMHAINPVQKGVQKIIVGMFTRGSYCNRLCDVPFTIFFCSWLIMNLCCKWKLISMMLYFCADCKYDSRLFQKINISIICRE